ncbi:MAG: hypothetical protein A2741_02250 [Candidatus Zambryskibacteria bacterium RIFCSPHIGHO2_01_FULL_43_27]|uniref:CYTH domain-containing protein n=1 Tax=Candidatus Zambryskibacteria bacterium RIFCSPLOWO2_01_FULL_43_17 TaxID=1802760 RepID=A0A1G2U4Y6_9BACT|nr:MAG: hypothetical protein A2741_02250 [Candidatus Zambryskibacteria bacterium RIFCSPHIGHO2_01_FULL_43_27]OHB00501.1 MAG: hypothetical protein A3E93_01735 [Candidatus Zambryskibacteria bacterium RIFCSPHIGHO2_12_FULL_43_12b]OHB04549.1 MAG: hypothetical protein A2920_01220 [Candidatus Zambryskibacteria bacterium RIFCSPLOWO2_01_FULL_43_17]
MSNYEIEIKSLLGNERNAKSLKDKIMKKGASLVAKSKQLNHYFLLNDAGRLKDALIKYISNDKREAFEKILSEGSSMSVRTRDTDGKVIFVIKASIGSDSSSNGVSRIEFEQKMDMSLDELDKLLLDAGLAYQAKWSREREEYGLDGTNICLDRNAGYGYLAEFERISEDRSQTDDIKKELYSLMNELGVEELPQDRLERMFAYYNSNWRDYYGTDKVFNIE